MPVLTIRTTTEEHKTVADGAAAAGKSGQVFCLEAIMTAARLAIDNKPAPAAPETEAESEPQPGRIRIHTFGAPAVDVTPRADMPAGAVSARQFQDGGDWYFYNSDGNIFEVESAVWPDAKMKAAIAELTAAP